MRLDTRIWAVITVVVVAALVAGGWFLGISPQVDAMNAANDSRKEVVAQNEAIAQKLVALKKASDDLDALQQEAVELEKIVPSDFNASDFITLLNGLAAASGVQITTISLSEGQSYQAPPEEAAETDAPEPGPTGAPAPSGTPAPVATGAPVPVVDARITSDNFVLLPLTISVEGGRDNILAFVKAVQSTERLVLVTTLTTTAAPTGDVYSSTVTGVMYALIRDDRLQIAKHLAEEAASAAASPAPEDSAEPEADAEAGAEPPSPGETPAG